MTPEQVRRNPRPRPSSNTDPAEHTITEDGYRFGKGDVVWNYYDGEWVEVLEDPANSSGGGWFKTSGSYLNSVRVAMFHGDKCAMTYLDEMVAGYIECAVWTGIEGERTLDSLGFTVEHVDEGTRRQMVDTCRTFLVHNAKDLIEADMDAGQAGHDLWLTRNHHGAGFWDRGLGERGDRLTEAASKLGEANVMVDGKRLVLS